MAKTVSDFPPLTQWYGSTSGRALCQNYSCPFGEPRASNTPVPLVSGPGSGSPGCASWGAAWGRSRAGSQAAGSSHPATLLQSISSPPPPRPLCWGQRGGLPGLKWSPVFHGISGCRGWHALLSGWRRWHLQGRYRPPSPASVRCLVQSHPTPAPKLPTSCLLSKGSCTEALDPNGFATNCWRSWGSS